MDPSLSVTTIPAAATPVFDSSSGRRERFASP
jgi:hypothetical protein